jgi:hypothetical protein
MAIKATKPETKKQERIIQAEEKESDSAVTLRPKDLK